MVGRTVSHYRILERLGGGGMGVVYKAEDTKLGRVVALKVLPPELVADPNRRRRFVQEARAASALNHPNIVTIHDIDEAEGVHFIAMEYVQGKTLDRLMARHGLPGNEVLKIAVQMAAALAKAHSAGIVHRDLKPTNVMVTHEGLIKVLDFGLAKLTEAAPTTEGETATALEPVTEEGTIVGTVGYMSPEQAEGKPVDGRSDIFSFGSVLYEMLTGQRAFQGDTKPSTIAAILKEEPKPLSELTKDLPREVERLVKRCLRKDREHRFQTMADLKVALEELKEESDSGELVKDVAAGLPLQTESGGIKPLLHRWALPIACGVLAVIAVGLSITWVFTHRPPPPSPQLTERRLTANPVENPVTQGAISLDGKYLAYGDPTGLHLKLIQTGETVNIPQPEGPGAPEPGSWWPNGWFPDGTKFITAGIAPGQPPSSWVVSVIGGPPRKLRDDADPWSVSPDGKLIAFGTGTAFTRSREIWLMGAQGEEPRRLVSGSEDDGFFWAAWSPDGQRVAFKRFHRAHGKFECSIESRALKEPQPTTVLSDQSLCDPDTKVNWYGDGRLVYITYEPDHHGNNFWEVKVDPGTSKPVRNPIRLTNWLGVQAEQSTGTVNGTQLAVTKSTWAGHILAAELEAAGRRLKNVRPLTLDENIGYPGQWMPDSRTLLSWSNRNGTWDIFKQALNQPEAQPLVAGPDVKGFPIVSPDGSWILYLSSATEQIEPASPVRIMRVPISGGAPQLVLEGRGFIGFGCARSPATNCVFAEETLDAAQLVFSGLDPGQGRGREITRVNLKRPNPGYFWDLSRDGTRIAFVQYDFGEGRIEILPLNGEQAHELFVKGRSRLSSLHWAADSKGLYVGTGGYTMSNPLLYVDLEGRAEVLWQSGASNVGTAWGVPSPDGRHLALLGFTSSRNVWLLENLLTK